MTAMTAFLHTLRVPSQSGAVLPLSRRNCTTHQGRGNGVIAVIADKGTSESALTDDGILTA